MEKEHSSYQNCKDSLVKSYETIKDALQDYHTKYDFPDQITYKIWTEERAIKQVIIKYGKPGQTQKQRKNILPPQHQRNFHQARENIQMSNQLQNQIIFHSQSQMEDQSDSMEFFFNKSEDLRQEIPINSVKTEKEKNQRQSYQRGPYKSYTDDQKRRAVNFLQRQIPITKISKMMNIPCKNIKRWYENGIDRKKGAGRKRSDPQMEEKLYAMIINNYQEGETLYIQNLQRQAISLAKDSKFKASKGWLFKFLTRYQIRQRYQYA